MARKQGERGKEGNIVGSELLKFTSVKKWVESLEQSAVSKGKLFTPEARNVRLGRLMEYTNDGEINPDFLLEEARKNINDTGKRLQDYFATKLKSGTEWNSCVTNLCFLRGFYSHNDIVFPKRMKIPKRHISSVKKTDSKTEIYGYDEATTETVFHNGTLKHFFDNLSFRDQTIGLSLLSTGADAADILNLRIGFVKDAKGNLSTAKRFPFHDNRLKDGIEFKTFFSVEATEYIRRYVQQERSNAKNDEYLFVKEDGLKIPTHALSMNFRKATEKMGYAVDEESNPFRPKRFRSLFRTACGIANVDNGYVMAMMGHSSDTSASHLEKSDGLFLKEYLKVEPYITVYGVDKSQITLMNETVDELRQKYEIAEKEIESDKAKIIELYEKTEKMKELQQSEKEKLEKQISEMYKYFHEKFDATMELLSEITDMPEGKVLLKKLREAKLEKEYEKTMTED
jgi:integrase